MGTKRGKKRYSKISIMMRKQFIHKVLIYNSSIKEVF
jgi:hypothetical protein